MEVFEFSDELVIDFLTTCGVEDEDGSVLCFSPFDGFFCDFDEVLFARLWFEDGDFDLFCECGELFNGGWAVEVTGDE